MLKRARNKTEVMTNKDGVESTHAYDASTFLNDEKTGNNISAVFCYFVDRAIMHVINANCMTVYWLSQVQPKE